MEPLHNEITNFLFCNDLELITKIKENFPISISKNSTFSDIIFKILKENETKTKQKVIESKEKDQIIEKLKIILEEKEKEIEKIKNEKIIQENNFSKQFNELKIKLENQVKFFLNFCNYLIID